ncbi:conserved hypothetical protein [Theileria orientalis strain Shintoku]|uniref:Uncharacterized protein n=1 Tax=Theileria orientalis strain Shintoku TaxID=869250 RepID=J7MCD9_THEOR|nr:conserved hypothetical protein [Theileria orientalis strain Shintoku]BAM42452.1 conserved hypothetical protein [Theileria orientalis strain Shintoku]|eukprot:XP_009692753.1 conserved hypothetical protein [Theileria orientalis strain Shintoku]
MVFDKTKKNQTATKVADNLNDLCKKLNTAIQRKKDLKAAKFIDIYDKCCVLRSQLEGLATKLLDSGNTREFEYVANISHTSSKILSNYEKLTSRPSYQPSLTNYSSLNTLNLTSNTRNVQGHNIRPENLEASVNVSTFDGMNSMGSYEGSYGNGGNINEIPRNLSKESSQSDWAKFDTAFDNHEKTPLSTVKEGYKTPSAKEGFEQSQRSANNYRTLRGGKEGEYREERRYKKDYLDTNMDTSIDYFNTSLDLHNMQDVYYEEDHEDYEQEEEQEEFGYPTHAFDEPEKTNERGRGTKGELRGYRVPGSKQGAGEREYTRVHDRDHTGDGYREHQGGVHRYREERGAAGYPRYPVGGELGPRYEGGKDKEEAREEFIVKTKLKRTSKGDHEEEREEGLREAEKDMAEYIKMLEKFLQMTKFNTVINRLSEHEDDYKTKLSSLQSYYADTYDSLEPTTTENTGVSHLGGVGGHSAGVVQARANMQAQEGERGSWRSAQGTAGEGLPRGGSQDETKLFGKEIEPLWRSESDGGLSNYLGDFLLNSDYRLIRTNKYEVHLDINQLNREDFMLNLQLYFVAKINIASLNMNYHRARRRRSAGTLRERRQRRKNGRRRDDGTEQHKGLTGGIMLVDERPLAKENSLTINLKVDLKTVIDFPVLQIKLIENDGNKSELRLLLPVGVFLTLVPLKYKLNQFEAFWNSMEMTVNRQIRLFLSKLPLDLNNLINLLWKYFSVYLQEDVLLLSSCGTEVLLGSIFIKQGTLVVVQLRSICNALIASTMSVLKELFSSLSVKYDANISNYTLKRVSSLPLNFQSNVQLNAVVKSIVNYK